MLLHLLRHAHAGDPSAWDGPDSLRPLSEKGRSQAERLGRFLAGLGFEADIVITSPKTRALQTAEIVAERIGAAVAIDDRLGGALFLAQVDGILADHGAPDRPVLVGHDPDMTELVSVLCAGAEAPMRKGAFARIEVATPLVPGTGTLRWLIPPDAIKPER